MKITLLVVGKTTDAHLEALLQEYTQRLTHYVSFAWKVIPELRNASSLSLTELKQQEGQLILRAVPESAEMILLDEHGKEMRSIDFATYIQKKMAASRDIFFVVGGPFGFSETVYERANGMVSISQMTFSHQMIRLLFTEQLYRALTILRGEKYHHE